MNEPNIVILAGGSSSRMKRSNEHGSAIDRALVNDAMNKSKAMIGVGENSRPFLDYLLSSIQRAGYKEVCIVVGERDSSIKSYYEQNHGAVQFPDLKIAFATQSIPEGRIKPLGTADALFVALQSKPGWRGKSFTVCNSDNLYSIIALQALLSDAHTNALIDYERSALKFAQERIAQFAVIKKDGEGYLTDLIEKPTEEQIAQSADSVGRVGVSMNIFRLSYDMILPFLEQIPLHPVRQEKELPVAVRMMAIEHPKSVWTIPLSEHVIDLTSQSDIPVVREFLRKEAIHS